MHEIYFFILKNPNKAIAIVQNLRDILERDNFNDSEKILITDKILSMLFNDPGFEEPPFAYFEILSFRNNLSPLLEDPKIKNHKFRFDVDDIKEEFKKFKTPNDRLEYLTNLVCDFQVELHSMDELDKEYYKMEGLFHFISAEIKRAKFDSNKDKPIVIAKYQISNKSGAKTDLIRVLNALYELRLIHDNNGQLPNKGEFIESIGKVLGVDLSSYHSNLSQALKNQPLEVNLKVFEEMKKITQDAHYTSDNSPTKNK